MAVQSGTKKLTRIPRTYIYALIPAAVALNFVGSYINGFLNLPLFLDMIGTAVAAMTIGPWWGAVAGAATNIIGGFTGSPISIPFAACNVIGALVWGYGVRWGMGKTFVKYFILALLSALFVTLMAVPIYVFLFGGATGHYADVLTAAFLGMGQHLIVSVFSSNILVSIADKLISSFVALAILQALPPSLTRKVEVTDAPTLKIVIWIAVGIFVAALLTFIFVYTAG